MIEPSDENLVLIWVFNIQWALNRITWTRNIERIVHNVPFNKLGNSKSRNLNRNKIAKLTKRCRIPE